jgi:hypothetical protein
MLLAGIQSKDFQPKKSLRRSQLLADDILNNRTYPMIQEMKYVFYFTYFQFFQEGNTLL